MIHCLRLFLLLTLCSCGYVFDGGEKIAISVPYVVGDEEGELTDALASSLARTASFRYVHTGGDWILRAKVKKTDRDRIGYRYDRDDKSGKRRENIIGIENRATVTVEFTVEDQHTGEVIIGPQTIQGRAAYDYVNPSSLQDLSFIDRGGRRETSIAFSLGQLDSVGAAGQDATKPIFYDIAERIVDGLIATK